MKIINIDDIKKANGGFIDSTFLNRVGNDWSGTVIDVIDLGLPFNVMHHTIIREEFLSKELIDDFLNKNEQRILKENNTNYEILYSEALKNKPMMSADELVGFKMLEDVYFALIKVNEIFLKYKIDKSYESEYEKELRLLLVLNSKWINYTHTMESCRLLRQLILDGISTNEVVVK